MIKDIQLSANLLYAAVVVAGHHYAVFSNASLIANIPIIHDYAAIDKISVRIHADSVAQLALVLAGVNEVIHATDFADTACFVEGVVFKAGARGVQLSRHNAPGLMADGEHIVFQLHRVGPHHMGRNFADFFILFVEQPDQHVP